MGMKPAKLFKKSAQLQQSEDLRNYFCQGCGNILVIDLGDEGGLFWRYDLDLKNYEEKFDSIMVRNLKRCSCGGRFGVNRFQPPRFPSIREVTIIRADRYALVSSPLRDLYELYVKNLYEPLPGNAWDDSALETQYKAAANIALLAGRPFEKKSIGLGHLMNRFESEEKSNEGRAEEDRSKAFLKWYAPRQKGIETSWRREARRQIRKWRNWWEKNKTEIPS